jgi:hypothetical protein
MRSSRTTTIRLQARAQLPGTILGTFSHRMIKMILLNGNGSSPSGMTTMAGGAPSGMTTMDGAAPSRKILTGTTTLDGRATMTMDGSLRCHTPIAGAQPKEDTLMKDDFYCRQIDAKDGTRRLAQQPPAAVAIAAERRGADMLGCKWMRSVAFCHGTSGMGLTGCRPSRLS